MNKVIRTFSSFSVDKIDEAKKFYANKLGVEIGDESMGLELILPGGRAFLYEKDNHEPATFTVLNFIVENIDQSASELVDKGIVFEIYENLPAEQDEKGILRGIAANQGPDIAWFCDPAGNVISIIQEK